MIDWPLAELLPHAGDMILIEQILSFDDEQIHTRLTVKPDGLFNRARRQPAGLGRYRTDGPERRRLSPVAMRASAAMRWSWASCSARANSNATSNISPPAPS